MRALRTCVVAASLCAGATLHAAQLPAKFDGNYAVDVETVTGTCQKLSRIALVVDNSKIAPVQGMPMQANGAIDQTGHVSLMIRYNEETARVIGVMTGTAGKGTWSSTPTVCQGRWHAQRVSQ